MSFRVYVTTEKLFLEKTLFEFVILAIILCFTNFSQIYHCNINSYGRICHQVLSESYTPSLTMKDILGCVYGLLVWPEPEDPLDR